MNEGVRTELALRLTPAMRDQISSRIVQREQQKLGLTWNHDSAAFVRRSEIGEMFLGDISD
jgi:hypothetical protein